MGRFYFSFAPAVIFEGKNNKKTTKKKAAIFPYYIYEK